MIHFTGYKESVLNDTPFAFWTFDYDRFDTNGQIIENLNIKDEMYNVHPAQIVNATDPHRGLSLGFPSLIPNQQGYGKSLAFCPDGYIGDSHNYAKSFLWIDHNEDFNFTNTNSFTIEFVYNKQSELDFSNRFVGMSIYPYIRPIFMKKDFIEIKFYCNDSQGATQIQCKLPNGQTIGIKTQLFDVIVHFAITFEITTVTTAQYKETATMYMNGQIVASLEQIVWDNHSTLSYPSPIYIGGTPDMPVDFNPIYRSDRHASTFIIDQIAVYAYALTPNQIANHFKKMHEYEAMIKIMQPFNFWSCNDISTTNTIKTHNAGVLDLISYGDYESNLLEETMLLQKPFLRFHKGAGAFLPYGFKYLFSTERSNGFSIGGWYKLTESLNKDTIILESLDVIYPFKGIRLTYNPFTKDLTLYNGGTIYSNTITYNNFDLGLWYNIIITYDFNTLKLFINGALINSINLNFTYSSNDFRLENHFNIGGRDGGSFDMTQWVYFRRALQPQEVAILYSYNITHIVKGVTTVETIPQSLLLRFYDNATGRLVNSVQSNPQTGEYTIQFPSDLPLYLIVTDMNDKQSKSRIYPNIIPSEIPDYPINIRLAN